MSQSKQKTCRFLNSPFVITVVGFILTGIVGGSLTYYWHKKEYTYKSKLEQEYSRIRAHSEARERLYNKIFNQTSEFIVASRRVISMYEHTIINPEQQKDIIKNFNTVSNKWFKESVVIRSQLQLLFFEKESSEVVAKIENEWTNLTGESKVLYIHIADLVTQYNVQDKSSELSRKFKECQKSSQEFVETVYNFGNNLILTIFRD